MRPKRGYLRELTHALAIHGAARAFHCSIAPAASSINVATILGFDTMTTCDAPLTTTISLAAARLAMKAEACGGIFLSSSPYTNQDGMVFQAVCFAFSLNADWVMGRCVTAITL